MIHPEDIGDFQRKRRLEDRPEEELDDSLSGMQTIVTDVTLSELDRQRIVTDQTFTAILGWIKR